MTDLPDNPLDELVADAADVSTETSSQVEAVQPDEGQGQPDANRAEGTPSAVQPEGQGQPDAQTGLYDLSTVPEEYRSHVERIAKDIDRNVNAKLQEAAEFRKSWEPYGELGVNEVDPEGLSALLQFAQDISDPDSARDAIMNLAQALEIDLGLDGLDDDQGELDAPDPVAELRAELDAIKQAEQSRQEQQQIAELRQQALSSYQAEYAEVEKLNGKPFSPEEKQRLIGLAKRFQLDNDEPIKAAYQLIQSISGSAEKALVESQPKPPAPAEPAGRASSTVQPVDSFEEAERLHRERNASAIT